MNPPELDLVWFGWLGHAFPSQPNHNPELSNFRLLQR